MGTALIPLVMHAGQVDLLAGAHEFPEHISCHCPAKFRRVLKIARKIRVQRRAGKPAVRLAEPGVADPGNAKRECHGSGRECRISATSKVSQGRGDLPMTEDYSRTGALTDLASYPLWLQDVVEACGEARRKVTEHELFRAMRDGALLESDMRRFLIGIWPVIEQFPQYMAMNLLKVQYGQAPGHESVRKYLIRNIRVEQNHVEYWIDWAQAHGVGREQLLFGARSGSAEALSHWCWHTCERDPLPAAMAATNYAIEGVTAEWTALVCSTGAYETGFAPEVRKSAMRWLKVHAHYDDTHPWEALEIIATLIGHRATPREVHGIQSGIRKSHDYMRMALDDCLSRAPRRNALRSDRVREERRKREESRGCATIARQ